MADENASIPFLFNKDKLNNMLSFLGCHNSNIKYEILQSIDVEKASRDEITSVLLNTLTKQNYNIPKELIHFTFDILERKRSFVLLLGGSSGTGKSTLARLLARRLGVKVISTDELRSELRHRSSRQESPLLFASSYVAGSSLIQQLQKTISEHTTTAALEIEALQRLSPRDLILEGFRRHTLLLLPEVFNLLKQLQIKKESVIIEGVHVTCEWIDSLQSVSDAILPVMLTVNEKAHRERLLKRKVGSYLSHWDAIRTLNDHFTTSFKVKRLPIVTDTDLSESIREVQRGLLTWLWKGARKGFESEAFETKQLSIPDPLSAGLDLEDCRLVQLEMQEKEKRKRKDLTATST